MTTGSVLRSVACFLVIAGAINWGLIGVFDYNVVTALFGMGTLTKVIYVVIGFAGVLACYDCACGDHCHKV